MNKLIAASTLSALALASGLAQARPHGDLATVLSATPVVERVAAAPQCFNEQVTAYENRRVVREVAYREPAMGPGTVLGAVLGGVIGHQFGNSTGGRDHGTAAGAVIGGLIGSSVDRDNGGYYRTGVAPQVAYEQVPVVRTVQRCEPAPPIERVVGYDVRYEYHGREYRTRLPYNPGATMPVDVEVQPRAERPGPQRPSYWR